MRFEMGGERVERRLDPRVVAPARWRPAEPRDPGRTLPVITE
jgi:hypothetical protein